MDDLCTKEYIITLLYVSVYEHQTLLLEDGNLMDLLLVGQ